VLDNVGVAAWRHSEHRGVWRRAPYRRLTADCMHFLESVGLEAIAHRVADTLGHGERRMLDIAMALACRPKLLLLDEPAAGLTEEGVSRLMKAVLTLPPDVTVIVVEHDFAFVAAVADTVTVLHEGRKLASGTPAEIAADAEVQAAYLGTAKEGV
jgi:branched-chain amino acid transport system ATP-binding protein